MVVSTGREYKMIVEADGHDIRTEMMTVEPNDGRAYLFKDIILKRSDR